MTDLRYRNCSECNYYVTYEDTTCPRCHFKLRPDKTYSKTKKRIDLKTIDREDLKKSVIKNVLTYSYFEFIKKNPDQNFELYQDLSKTENELKQKGDNSNAKICKNCSRANEGKNSDFCVYCGSYF